MTNVGPGVRRGDGAAEGVAEQACVRAYHGREACCAACKFERSRGHCARREWQRTIGGRESVRVDGAERSLHA